MNEIKTETLTGTVDVKKAGFVIAWVAKQWEIENYIVWIEWDKAWYKKIDSNVWSLLENIRLDKLYWEIVKKIYIILDKYWQARI
jgi:hypothetical protein